MDEGDQFLVDGSVKVLKDYCRKNAIPGDGDWQTLVEKSELRHFALAVYSRCEANNAAPAAPAAPTAPAAAAAPPVFVQVPPAQSDADEQESHDQPGGW